MAPTKPTMLLVHGSFGTPAAFNKLTPFLHNAGYETMSATYPSANPEKPLEVTVEKDITYVRDTYLSPLIEREQKDLVMVLHSYAGIVGAAAAIGLSKTDRVAQGLNGGIVGLICIAANIARENQSLAESAGGQWPPWLIKDKPRDGLCLLEPLMELLCEDCDPLEEAEIRQGIVPQGYHAYDTNATAPCWAEPAYTGRLAYIRTLQDKINPTFAQDLWIQGTETHWDVVSMDTSHAPYLSQPERLAEILAQLSSKFEAL